MSLESWMTDMADRLTGKMEQAPAPVKDILGQLHRAGYTAVLVGGCVRDVIVGKTPKDWDIGTDATVQMVQELFRDQYRVLHIGQAFDTATVITEVGSVEIATFRNVFGEAGDDLFTDLSLRDYTINSIAYTPEMGIIDPCNGVEDLRDRVLRAIRPEVTLKADPVRILRAARFSAEYDLRIDPELERQIRANVHGLIVAADERIRDVIERILILPQPSKALRLLDKWGALQYMELGSVITPMVGYDQGSPWHDRDLFEHTLAVVDHTPAHITVRWAALLHDCAKPETRTEDEAGIAHYYGHDVRSAELASALLKTMRLPSHKRKLICRLIENHMFNPADLGPKGLKRIMRRVGKDNMMSLLELMSGDLSGTSVPDRISYVSRLQQMTKDILQQDAAFKTSDLKISGKDLLEMGVQQGPDIGAILQRVLQEVIDEELPNERDAQLNWVNKHLEEITSVSCCSEIE